MEWSSVGRKIIKKPGAVLVMGRVNSGKSTLTRFLVQQGRDQGRRVSVVDADLGQASFGPPTCISLCFWSQATPPILRFIGSTSPAGHLLQVTVGTELLVERAKSNGAELLVVDTSGMVQGQLGMLLKLHKIELIRPDYLLVLQRGRELSPLLERIPRIPGVEICPLPVSPAARTRSAEERSHYRKESFQAYFNEAQLRSLALRRPRRILIGLYPSIGRLMGLLDEAGETLGLGIVKRYDSKNGRMDLITPVDLEKTRMVQGGTLRLKEDWSEM